MADWDVHSEHICRVCRSEGGPDKPLFHPCVCTGSIKFIHQECLVQWLKYSRKEFCELCNHRFSFTPIYSPDMPKRLPFQDIITGLLKSIGRAVRYWFHYTLVAFAWLGVVPLMACRIYRSLFTGSVSSLLTLPLDMLSTENIATDCLQGCFVVTCTLCAFISLVWLREQILHGGGPDWLDNENPANHQQRGNAAANQGAAAAGANQNGGNGQGAANQNGAEEDGEEDGEEDENEVNNQPQDEVNWNPIEWDRAAEELTWERLLGLDGSLVFLEHVFWVVSLNTLFILVFAFCPYHIGHFTIMGIKVNELVQASQFEGLVTTLTGYTVIALSLVVLHTLAALVKFNKSKRIIGLCYLVVKVALLVVVEIGIFPLICGWWLDICSLAMFDATLKDREKSFSNAPGTSMFIHWLVGMVYVFYFASFILLLREVLRPGVLWFLRNLNDPEFNPIQEMIHLPVLRHMRRFLASMVIFGTTVLLMLWLPVQLIKKLIPGFLPYHIMLSSDAPVSELSLELLLLQVVLPALLEQGHTRTWLKGLVRGWTVGVAWLLDLKSYLLGDSPEDTDGAERVAPNIILPAQPGQQGAAQAVQEELGNQGAAQEAEHQGGAEEAVDLLGHQGAALQAVNLLDHQEAAQNVEAPVGAVQHGAGHQGAAHGAAGHQGAVHGAAGHQVAAHGAAGHQGAAQAVGNLGAIHQALLHQGGPSGYQPFHKPSFFFIRMMLLFVLMWSTLFLASLVTLILPVFFGRMLMSLWMGSVRIHELYTAACGLYVCWVVLRLGAVLYQWIPQGWAAIMTKVKEWTLLALKSLMIAFLLIGVAPLLLGLLFELVVVAPLRVPLNQTPVFFPWQDWALGVLHAKIICAVTMMGPQWWLKNVMERVYNDGLRNMNLTFILTNLCIPVIGCLSMSLAAPYVVAKSIVPMFGVDFETENLVYRRIYPSLLTLLTFVGFCTMQVKQFRKLYEHIKNDKYLVGQRLVNYTRPES